MNNKDGYLKLLMAEVPPVKLGNANKVRNGRVKVRIWTMTKSADIEKLVDMIFAMVKEFAQISKRGNYTRGKRKDR